jgi:hypothetical protein
MLGISGRIKARDGMMEARLFRGCCSAFFGDPSSHLGPSSVDLRNDIVFVFEFLPFFDIDDDIIDVYSKICCIILHTWWMFSWDLLPCNSFHVVRM